MSVAGPDTAGPLAIVMLVCAAIAVWAFLAAGAAAGPPRIVEQTV
ncbi:hypothetical protein [Gordonia oryzae]|nr:hypothetical protein [Gordonia oryzae]